MVGSMGHLANGDGLLILGFSDENIRRMRVGHPVHITHKTHPFVPEGMEILVLVAKDEETLIENLEKAGLVEPGTPEQFI